MKIQSLFIIRVIALLFLPQTFIDIQNTLLTTPTPSEVLAPNVQTLETLPIINPDNKNHELYFWNNQTNQWAIIPYPAGLAQVIDTRLRTDGTFLVSSVPLFLDQPVDTEAVWVFDPNSKSIAPAPTTCGTLKDLPNEGKWRIYRNDTDQLFYLCFTETEDIVHQLPLDLQPMLCEDWQRIPAISPDKKWIVFADCLQNFSLYSFNLNSKKVTYLGKNELGDDENIIISQWADNIHPIIYSYETRNESRRTLYFADVSKQNSLSRIVSAYGITTDPIAQFETDTRTYLWVPQEITLEGVDPTSCQLHQFDIKKFKETSFKAIPHVCGLGIGIPDGTTDRVYFDLSHSLENPPSVSMIRYNFNNGEMHSLFTDEIQWVDSISPKGTYIAVLLDKSASILDIRSFRTPMPYTLIGPVNELKSPEIAIIELRTGKVVYRRAITISSDAQGTSSYPRLNWLNDGKILVTMKDNNTENYRIVTLQRQGPSVEIPILGTVYAFTANRLALSVSNPNQYVFVDLYSVIDGQITPFIKNVDGEHYSLNISWRKDDGLLEVVISDRKRFDAISNRDFVVGHWLVQVSFLSSF